MRTRSVGIIIKGRNILLIKRNKNGELFYVLPGGGVKEGETPENACIREIKEETTLQVNRLQEFYIIEDKENPEIYFLITDFIGLPQADDFKKKSPSNTYDLEWLPLSQLASIDLRPEIISRIIATL